MRKIIHIDMDCFYAAVEVRDHPRLRGLPVAVGGSSDRRGVLTTANYEARKFGVRSAMSTSKALRLCPQLVLMPVNFDKYRAVSRLIHEVFREFTTIIQPLSLDEAYLDVSDCDLFENNATKIASAIRQRIYAKTQLTASAGIAPNKFLAKIASDWRKPNGQFTIAPAQIDDFVRTLPVEKIPGVGKVTAAKMHAQGLYTCADLQLLSLTELNHRYGKWGEQLFDLARGIDARRVVVDRQRKSLSVENTYARDLVSVEECLEKLPRLFKEFRRRLDRTSLEHPIKASFVKIKFSDFTATTLERSSFNNPQEDVFASLLREAYFRAAKPVRLLGVGIRLAVPERRQRDLQLEFDSSFGFGSTS